MINKMLSQFVSHSRRQLCEPNRDAKYQIGASKGHWNSENHSMQLSTKKVTRKKSTIERGVDILVTKPAQILCGKMRDFILRLLS
jgi:hypothetical protein